MISRPNANAAAGQIYSSLDVSRMTGVSLRQLQWWDEQGVVTPLQRGRRRLYNPTEVLLVSIIVGLRRKRLSLQKIRKIVESLKGDGTIAELALDPDHSDVYLLTDGTRTSMQFSPQAVIDFQVASSTPMMLLCISDLVYEMGWAHGATLRKPLHIETGGASGEQLQPVAASKAS